MVQLQLKGKFKIGAKNQFLFLLNLWVHSWSNQVDLGTKKTATMLHLSYENFNVKLFLLYKNKYMKVIFKPWCLHLYQVINDPCIKFTGLCMILVS